MTKKLLEAIRSGVLCAETIHDGEEEEEEEDDDAVGKNRKWSEGLVTHRSAARHAAQLSAVVELAQNALLRAPSYDTCFSILFSYVACSGSMPIRYDDFICCMYRSNTSYYMSLLFVTCRYTEGANEHPGKSFIPTWLFSIVAAPPAAGEDGALASISPIPNTSSKKAKGKKKTKKTEKGKKKKKTASRKSPRRGGATDTAASDNNSENEESRAEVCHCSVLLSVPTSCSLSLSFSFSPTLSLSLSLALSLLLTLFLFLFPYSNAARRQRARREPE